MDKINNRFDKVLALIGIVLGAMLIDSTYDDLILEYFLNFLGIVMVLAFHRMYVTNKYLWGAD